MTETPDDNRSTLSRRKALTLLGMAGVVLVPACQSGGSDTGSASAPTSAGSSPPTSAGSTAAPTTVPPGSIACVLTPEFTEGPFYLDLDDVRSDITEGRPGAPLELKITVVDADGCTPIKDAAVDIWHADAGGVYSGFERAQGETFLRGTQISGGDGLVTFRTVYPGWYRGRAVHIHTKVHVSGAEVHTGQLFFDDGFTDTVYAAAPYNARPGRDVRNTGDGIFRRANADSAVLDVRSQAGANVAEIIVGVRPGAGRPNQA